MPELSPKNQELVSAEPVSNGLSQALTESKKSEGEIVVIQFGTIFRVFGVKGEEGEEDVVTDPCPHGDKEEYFFAAKLSQTEEGKRYFSLGGTARPEDIEIITGQMTKAEVLAAAKLGYTIGGFGDIYTREQAEIESNFRQGAERPPREIVIRKILES